MVVKEPPPTSLVVEGSQATEHSSPARTDADRLRPLVKVSSISSLASRTSGAAARPATDGPGGIHRHYGQGSNAAPPPLIAVRGMTDAVADPQHLSGQEPVYFPGVVTRTNNRRNSMRVVLDGEPDLGTEAAVAATRNRRQSVLTEKLKEVKESMKGDSSAVDSD